MPTLWTSQSEETQPGLLEMLQKYPKIANDNKVSLKIMHLFKTFCSNWKFRHLKNQLYLTPPCPVSGVSPPECQLGRQYMMLPISHNNDKQKQALFFFSTIHPKNCIYIFQSCCLSFVICFWSKSRIAGTMPVAQCSRTLWWIFYKMPRIMASWRSRVGPKHF